MRRIATVVTGCLGCVSSYQSARVLPVGTTQVTAAVSRIQVIESDAEDELVYAGELQVRHGFAKRFDAALRLGSTPGADGSASMLTIDPKVQITAPSSWMTVSLALPVGLAWEEDETGFQGGGAALAPTMLVGARLAPTTELVFAPKLLVLYGSEDGGEFETELGASLGLRFTNPSGTWAVHPELSFLFLQEDSGDRDTVKIISFGVAISAGN